MEMNTTLPRISNEAPHESPALERPFNYRSSRKKKDPTSSRVSKTKEASNIPMDELEWFTSRRNMFPLSQWKIIEQLDKGRSGRKRKKPKDKVLQSVPGDHNYHLQPVIKKRTRTGNLIGDFSRECSLPIIKGRNRDVTTIASLTVVKLLCDEPKRSFIICDCRYPYEYAGGHIKGAINIYNQEMLVKEFFIDDKPTHPGKMVLFYCEFSSRRAPSMYRFLRHKDRSMHQDSYPALFYPEMYVIEGGYKHFYTYNHTLCEPSKYIEMKDKRFSDKLAMYRVKYKDEEMKPKFRDTRIAIMF